MKLRLIVRVESRVWVGCDIMRDRQTCQDTILRSSVSAIRSAFVKAFLLTRSQFPVPPPPRWPQPYLHRRWCVGGQQEKGDSGGA